MQYIRDNWPPILVIFIGSAASLYLALSPLDVILTHLVFDDAFYYFQIARNIVQGLGSTFDGINPTNGYHPLWLLSILPIFHFLSVGGVNDIAPINGVLVLSAFLNLGTGIVLSMIIRRYTKSAWVMASALGFWFLNPFVQYQMINGLETSISIFFTALFFLAAMRASEVPSTRRWVEAGCIAGLMMLARLDNVFYFVGYLLFLLYANGIKKAIRPTLISGIAATIIVAPWLVWNALNFGMLFTSSSVAFTVVNHQLIVQDHGTSWFQTFKAVVYHTDRYLREVEPQTGIPLVLLLLCGICIGWLLFGRGKALRERMSNEIPVELFVASGFVLSFIANASIRWTARPWYFIAIDLLIAIWLGWFLEKLREEGYLRPIAATTLILFSVAVFYIDWSKNYRKGIDGSRQVVETSLWMNNNLPKGATIGAFNSGILGYFSTHRVVNLDGLVNNEAYMAIREKDIWNYIESENIRYIADHDVYLTYRYKSFLGIDNVFDHLQLVYEEPEFKTHVYKVK